MNNGAYTLASASKILSTANEFRALYGLPLNDTWTNISASVAIPYDPSGITIEYDGMNNSVPVKQADVVLNTYPLDYTTNYTAEQSRTDLAYVFPPLLDWLDQSLTLNVSVFQQAISRRTGYDIQHYQYNSK